MSLISRSLPGLFGGVSQQIPAMRHPTHCSEQTNAIATVVDGLFKRPGTKHLYNLALTGGTSNLQGTNGALTVHYIDKASQGKFLLVLGNQKLKLYNLATGAEVNVSVPHGFTYLASSDPENDFRCVTVADYTFIVNRSVTPAMNAAVAAANPTNVAYVNIRTAVPNVKYTVFVDLTAYEYTSTSSPTSSQIASQLASLINASPNHTALVLPGTNIIKITKDAGGAIDVESSDGWGNSATQSLHRGVTSFSQLPPKFEVDYVLTITGETGNADPYYVRWDGSKYVETLKPGVQYQINPATMPFQLRPSTGSDWVFERVTWEERKTGDDETNPLPSFIGTPIRNVFFHRNRLGFLAGDSVVLSRAGDYFNFWGASAQQVLDSDPIDVAATSENVPSLEWAVVYNKTLLVWSAGKQQFALTAGDVLTPSTARLVPSTTFETYAGAAPVSVGNRVMYPAPLGSNTQIGLYRVSEDTITDYSQDITEWVPSYIPSEPRELAASTVYKAMVVVPRGVSKELPLFKWETDDRDQLVQKAWQRITLGTADSTRILKAFWEGRTLWLVMWTVSAQDPAGGRLVVETIDFEEGAVDAVAGIGLRLDRRAQATGGTFSGGNTRVDLPYLYTGPVVILKCVNGQAPLPLTEATSRVYDTVNLKTQLYVEGNHTGATFWLGVPYTMRYVFTEPFMRDSDGSPIMEAELKLVKVKVRYEETGEFTAKVTPFLRGTYEYPFSGSTVGLPNQGVSQLGLSRGDFSIPVYTRANEVEVAIEATSHLPAKFPYAEWVGAINMKARR